MDLMYTALSRSFALSLSIYLLLFSICPISMALTTCTPQVCEGPISPNRILCRTPTLEDKMWYGLLSLELDGSFYNYSGRFPSFKNYIIHPFENDEKRFKLKNGDDEIEAHVRSCYLG